ncbi:MAG: Crp/Fnr family transcriptional regulator [Bacteroidetes bacterium]|nr:Crp/Fnr family transcriptional regulator [Bacteroidota bacterium]
MRESTEFLQQVPLFQRLSENELSLIRGLGGLKKYSKDQIIFLEGDPFTGFYVVMSGTVKVYKLSAEGDETVLHILKPCKSFAETPLFTDSSHYPACAQAIEDSMLFHIPKVEFRRLMEENSSVAIKISEAFASRLMELNKKFGQLLASAEGKLARYMMNEVIANGSINKPEPSFVLGISKKDLAAQLGIAVETLSRNLRKMKDDRLIRESSKRIFVTDLKRMRDMAG